MSAKSANGRNGIKDKQLGKRLLLNKNSTLVRKNMKEKSIESSLKVDQPQNMKLCLVQIKVSIKTNQQLTSS